MTKTKPKPEKPPPTKKETKETKTKTCKKSQTTKKKNQCQHVLIIQEQRETINLLKTSLAAEQKKVYTLETSLAAEQKKVSTLETRLQEQKKGKSPETCPEIKLTKRISLKQSRRKRIIDKQENKCNICHEELSLDTTSIDHILALKFGGGNDDKNLQALCNKCHKHKTVLENVYEPHLRNAMFLKPILQQLLHV
jgi:5-methylcytosine-specific restriction enzyme A